MHAVAHDVKAREVRAQHKTGVRAVEDAHLALFVRGDVRHDDAVEAGRLEGQLVLEPRRAFDVPDAEYLAHVDQLVVVAVFLVHLGRLCRVLDAAGHDAVDQRGAERALAAPSLEVRFQTPLLDVLADALLQFLAVVVDQLAGQDDQRLFAGLPARIQHLGQLGREGGRGAVILLAGGIVNDASLGGVGHDELEVVRNRDLHHRLVVRLFIGVQAAADRGNDALAVDLLAVFAAAQVQGVQALLLVDLPREAGRDRLHQNGLAVPADLLIGHIEPVVDKCTQEIALAELKDLFRRAFQDVALIAGLFQYFII